MPRCNSSTKVPNININTVHSPYSEYSSSTWGYNFRDLRGNTMLSTSNAKPKEIQPTVVMSR